MNNEHAFSSLDVSEQSFASKIEDTKSFFSILSNQVSFESIHDGFFVSGTWNARFDEVETVTVKDIGNSTIGWSANFQTGSSIMFINEDLSMDTFNLNAFFMDIPYINTKMSMSQNLGLVDFHGITKFETNMSNLVNMGSVNFQMMETMTSACPTSRKYHLVSDWDSYLLSVLDTMLLSEMEYVQSGSSLPPSVPVSFSGSSSTTSAGGVTFSWSHSVASGPNQILIVACGLSDGSVTSLTYGAQNLTHLGSANSTVAFGEIWYLVNPPVGTDTITVNVDSNNYVEIVATNWINVNQSSPLIFGSASTVSQAVDLSFTLTSNDVFLAHLKYWKGSGLGTPNAGQTQIFSGTSDGSWRSFEHYKIGSGVVTIGYSNLYTTDNWSQLFGAKIVAA